MRLLYLHQYFSFPNQSSGTRSYDLSQGFINHGIDVTIITSSSSTNERPLHKRWTYMEQDGLKLWILRNSYSQKMSFYRRIWSFCRFSFWASLKSLSVKCDAVLATSTPLTIAIPALLKKRFSGTPFIFEVRDVWPEVPIQLGYIKNKMAIKFLRWFEKHIYKRASYVVPLSKGMEADIRTRVLVSNMKVIPNICELERFKQIKECPLDFDFSDKKVILYAGKFGRVNGLIYLARLAKETKTIAPNICYLLVGYGNEEDTIRGYAEREGLLNQNFFIHKPVRKQDLPYLYSKAIMGSSFVTNDRILWDNSANKFFDTLAAGRPILINHGGWQADVIKETGCGIALSPELTPDDVQRFIDFVTDDETLATSGGKASQKAEDYSLPVAVEKYMKIFQSMDLI